MWTSSTSPDFLPKSVMFWRTFVSCCIHTWSISPPKKLFQAMRGGFFNLDVMGLLQEKHMNLSQVAKLFREVYVAILGDFWETNIGIGECSQPKVSLSCLRQFSFCCDISPWSGKLTNKSMFMKMIASIWWRYPIVPRPDLTTNQKKQSTNFPRSFADFLCGEFEKDQRGRVAHRERSWGDIYGRVWCLNCLLYVWGSACKKRKANARRDMWMFIAKYRSFSFYIGVTWSNACFFPFEFYEPCIGLRFSIFGTLWPPQYPPNFSSPKTAGSGCCREVGRASGTPSPPDGDGWMVAESWQLPPNVRKRIHGTQWMKMAADWNDPFWSSDMCVRFFWEPAMPSVRTSNKKVLREWRNTTSPTNKYWPTPLKINGWNIIMELWFRSCSILFMGDL